MRLPSEMTFKEYVEEWWQIVLSLPMLLAFLPGCDPQVARGFHVLSLAPDWFREAVGAAILFAFGSRTLRGLRLSSFGRRTTKAPITETPPKAGT